MDARRPGCPACRAAIAGQAAELMRMARAGVVCTAAHQSQLDGLMEARVGLVRDTSSAAEIAALWRDVRFWQMSSIEQVAVGIMEASLPTVGEAEALGRLEDYLGEVEITPIERRDLRLFVWEQTVWRDHVEH
ncbi:MAG: hypothetical protein DI629_07280 [Mesorhizobium amorphae]|nr:MAG: hypothetical protein DI629_07280 [Mesorhizobium amorphae]